MDGSEQDRADEREELLLREETLEKDRLVDALIEGERSGVTSDGEGEAESVGESLMDGIFAGISAVTNTGTDG